MTPDLPRFHGPRARFGTHADLPRLCTRLLRAAARPAAPRARAQVDADLLEEVHDLRRLEAAVAGRVIRVEQLSARRVGRAMYISKSTPAQVSTRPEGNASETVQTYLVYHELSSVRDELSRGLTAKGEVCYGM